MTFDEDDANLCDLHGVNRRDCVPCLRQWVDDLLETQTWRNMAMRDLRRDNARLRHLLRDNGIEEPAPKVDAGWKRPDPGPPKGTA